MAIKVGDEMLKYINADELIKKVKEREDLLSIYLVKEAIDKMPSADVAEVKHGKWIENSTGTSHKCSVCGCPVLYVFDMDLSYREHSDYCECLSNFCPHCGADMRGETE